MVRLPGHFMMMSQPWIFSFFSSNRLVLVFLFFCHHMTIAVECDVKPYTTNQPTHVNSLLLAQKRAACIILDIKETVYPSGEMFSQLKIDTYY